MALWGQCTEPVIQQAWPQHRRLGKFSSLVAPTRIQWRPLDRGQLRKMFWYVNGLKVSATLLRCENSLSRLERGYGQHIRDSWVS